MNRGISARVERTTYRHLFPSQVYRRVTLSFSMILGPNQPSNPSPVDDKVFSFVWRTGWVGERKASFSKRCLRAMGTRYWYGRTRPSVLVGAPLVAQSSQVLRHKERSVGIVLLGNTKSLKRGRCKSRCILVGVWLEAAPAIQRPNLLRGLPLGTKGNSLNWAMSRVCNDSSNLAVILQNAMGFNMRRMLFRPCSVRAMSSSCYFSRYYSVHQDRRHDHVFSDYDPC